MPPKGKQAAPSKKAEQKKKEKVIEVCISQKKESQHIDF